MELYSQAELGTCDVVVVVPASREATQDVDALLASIHEQNGIEGITVGVLVIVNRSRDQVGSVVDLNDKLLDYLKEFLHLETAEKSAPVAAPTPVQALLRSISNEIRLIVVDVSSEGHALNVCNAGIVRNIGTLVAGRFLKNGDCFVLGTDADSKYCPGYIKYIMAIASDPQIQAATGPVMSILKEDDRFELYRARAFRENMILLRYILDEIVSTSHITPHIPLEQEHMPGANMAFRWKDYFTAGGYPCSSGGEDTGLSTQMLADGKTVLYESELAVYTHARESDRTNPANSFGADVTKAAAIETWADHPVYSNLFYEKSKAVLALVTSLNEQSVPAEYWKSMVASQLGCSFDEAAELYALNQVFPRKVWIGFHKPFVDRLEAFLTAVPGIKKPLEEVLADAEKSTIETMAAIEPIFGDFMRTLLRNVQEIAKIDQEIIEFAEGMMSEPNASVHQRKDLYPLLALDESQIADRNMNNRIVQLQYFILGFSQLVNLAHLGKKFDGDDKVMVNARAAILKMMNYWSHLAQRNFALSILHKYHGLKDTCAYVVDMFMDSESYNLMRSKAQNTAGLYPPFKDILSAIDEAKAKLSADSIDIKDLEKEIDVLKAQVKVIMDEQRKANINAWLAHSGGWM